MLSAAERMVRARAALVLDHPFFGALALRLKLQPDSSIETCAVNSVRLRYSPAFVDSLSDPELRGVLAHEVLHCAAGHPWRRAGRDLARWNIACDAAINGHVLAAGLTLPAGGVPGEDGAAEEIYARMPADGPGGSGNGMGGAGGGQQGQQAAGGGSPGDTPGGMPDPGGCGGVDDAPADAGSDEGAGGSEEDWKIATVQAAQAAKAFGKLPGIAARLVDEFTRPAVDWRTVLADFVTRTARNDYDWARPSVRHLQRGIVLPSLRSNELPDVVVAIDTSGSLDSAELCCFAGAVSDVLAAYPTTVHVLAADAHVQSVQEYQTADLPIKLADLPGGGGTDFRPVFQWVADQGLTPACLIYLTDMYGSFPDTEPDYPVLWVATSDCVGPFGDTVQLPRD